MEAPIEGSRRSKLTLPGPLQPMEAIHFNQMRRVREPVSRSKSGVQGKVADVLFRRSRHAESQNELRAFRILVATARADLWQEQPFFLEYHDDGKKHRYTPDVLITWGSHKEVVEIKEDREAELPENHERFRLIRELLSEHGYYFRLWKRSEICAEPRLMNASLMLRYRCVKIPAVEHEKIRRAFSATPESTLGAFRQTPRMTVQSILRLVLSGTLHIDWWEPLGLDSRVSIVPIGRQVWPFPPRVSA